MKKYIKIIAIAILTLTTSSCDKRTFTSSRIETMNNPEAITGFDYPYNRGDFSQYSQHNTVRDGKLKIAALLPLTGKGSATGESLKNAIQMALYDLKQDDLEVMYYDTESSQQGAQTSALNAISNGAEAIIGPLYSENVTAIKPYIEGRGINVISFTNNNSVLQSNIFSINYLKPQELQIALNFLNGKASNVALAIPNERYNKILPDEMIYELCYHNNLNCTKIRYDNSDPKSYEVAAKKISNYDNRKSFRKRLLSSAKNSNTSVYRSLLKSETVGQSKYDATILIGGYDDVLSINAFLTYQNYDKRHNFIMALSELQTEKTEKEEALQGVYYTGNSVKGINEFEDKYKYLVRKTPSKIAFLAYDATLLAGKAIQNNQTLDTAFLTNPNGFKGTSGTFKFLPDGYNQRNTNIYKIGKEGAQILVSSGNSQNVESLQAPSRPAVSVGEIQSRMRSLDFNTINKYVIY